MAFYNNIPDIPCTSLNRKQASWLISDGGELANECKTWGQAGRQFLVF